MKIPDIDKKIIDFEDTKEKKLERISKLEENRPIVISHDLYHYHIHLENYKVTKTPYNSPKVKNKYFTSSDKEIEGNMYQKVSSTSQEVKSIENKIL